MKQESLLNRINSLEAAASLLIDECRKTREFLEDAKPSKANKDLETKSMIAHVLAKRRAHILRNTLK